MGFHHTLFVRQSIEDVDELKKYMYSGGNLRFPPAPPFPYWELT